MITPVQAPCLLIAMPSMQDSNFAQTVLLLAEHNPEGAVAFVLNRPSTISLKSMISAIDRDIPEAIPAWYGGPVDTTTAVILHDRKPADGDTELAPCIYLSTTGKILDQLIEHESKRLDLLLSEPGDGTSARHSFRFIVGYAGWGAGQLDEELRAGAWLMCPLDRRFVFDTSWNHIWDEVITMIGLSKTASIAPQAIQSQQLLH